MAQQSYAFFAVLIALTFALMTLTACATPGAGHAASLNNTMSIAGVEEFHGAHIGRDTLRSRLPSEN